MKNFLFITILISLSIGLKAQSNSLLITKAPSLSSSVSSNLFMYDGKTYKFHKMEDVFINNPGALGEFNKAIRTRKNAIIFGGLSLSALVFGALSFRIFDTANGEVLDDASTVALLSWGIAMPAFATTGLIVSKSYKKKRSKAITAFNNARSIGQLSNPMNPSLSLTGSQNGFGLTLQF